MQLASILQHQSGHGECYMQITVTMPGADTHIIVQSHDEIYVMIDYFTDVNLANPDDAPMNPNFNAITISKHVYTASEPRWQSTMDMMVKS
jgi:hypothetical protein